MAEHLQQQIVDWTVARLAGIAGVQVFDDDRVDPLQVEDLPAIVVRGPGGGAVEADARVRLIQRREFAVEISVYLRLESGVARAARAIGLQIEQRLAAQPSTAGGLCQSVQLAADPELTLTGEGDARVAQLVQSWTFAYRVRPDAPDRPI